MESLRDKLKSLGVQIGTEHIQKQLSSNKPYPIDSVVIGENRENRFGSTFVVEKDFPIDYCHGKVDLCNIPDYDLLAQWAKTSFLTAQNYHNILFLDAETSGLAGGAGTFAFMIGLGHFTATGFKLIQLFLRDPAHEYAFLITLDQILSSFDVIATFNGKSFDVPLIASRYILQKHPVPFQDKDHIDLLHLARRVWKNRLASRTLGNLETEILNLARTQEEVPGWMVPELYIDYLKTKDARPLAGVFYHNEIDILSLAALHNLLAQMLNDPLETNDSDSLDCIAIARLYEELGHLEKAIHLYEHSIDQGMPVEFLVDTLNRYAKIFKRSGDWSSALALWERAAKLNDIQACIELAKYHEHILHDPSSALAWTNLANEQLMLKNTTHINSEINKSAIDKRHQRLTNKLIKSQDD